MPQLEYHGDTLSLQASRTSDVALKIIYSSVDISPPSYITYRTGYTRGSDVLLRNI